MHIQVVNFKLSGITGTEYEAACDDIAQAFSELPGLISKHWLADPESNTYGGIYIWESRKDMEVYLESDLFFGVQNNPAFVDVESRDYGVIEGPTRITRGF